MAPIGAARANLSRVPSFIPDSAVARWNFEDDSDTSTAIDSWNDNNGTINGATYSTTSQIDDLSMSFDGADDEITLPSGFLPTGSDPFSVSVWFQADATSDNTMVFWGTGNSNSQNDTLLKNGNVNHAFFGNDLAGTVDISDGNWHQAVITYDGSDRVIYVDGSEDVSDSPGSVSVDDQNQALGVRKRTGGNHYDGLLDDTRIFDKALSATEVSNLYNTGSISG